MSAQRFVQAALVVAGLLFLLPGIWAFVDPGSFYDEAAPFPPYNEHFIHDIGAFQIGIGLALLAAALLADATLAVIAGAAAGAIMHLLAHLLDEELGGTDRDLPLFGLVALLLVAAAVVRWRTRPEA